MSDLELRLDGEELKEEVLSTMVLQGTEVEASMVDLRLNSRHLDDLRWLQEDPIVDLFGPGEGRCARAEEAAQHIGGNPLRGRFGLRAHASIAGPGEDVEYRIVASKLLDQVGKCADVTVVRPGTFQAIERYIQQGGYDLVHYDGHGAEGLLWFEDQLVEASRLGQMLARSGVPLFVLNACRSAVNRGIPSRAGPNQQCGSRPFHRRVGVLAMSANVRVTLKELGNSVLFPIFFRLIHDCD